MTMTVTEIDAPSTANTLVSIVAVPSSLDSIRLVGDEEKHATLLFFGDMTTLPADAKNNLLSTLGQATNVVDPFTERVRTVSRLGEDDPPALVAMLSNRSLGSIRDMLLINPEVTRLLSNTKQHVGYIPHVTLGHPDYKGEAILREAIKPVYRINFDRLALWWGDERVEFDLKSRSSEDYPVDEEFSMSAETNDFLAHFGVKGMKWGVRRENRIQSLERVGSGTASKGEKARYALTEATGAAVRRHGSLPASAANKAANMRAVDARRARGEGTLSDLLKAHGADRYIDTGRVDRDRRAANLVQKHGSTKVSDLNSMHDNSKPASPTDRQRNAHKAVSAG